MLTEALAGLRDVGDVQGSFLLGGAGELVARDLPPVFYPEIFAEVGPRLVRLRETLESSGEELGTLTLRFSEHKLHLRSVGALLLGVVTSSTVNGPALRMAINLVARRVAAQGSKLEREVPSAASVEATPVVPPFAPRSVPPVSKRTDITFRGRKL
jgi:predicted regulator of Ras-like GTPase activity (Roadblock/LC7/MglB family)